MPAAAHQAAPQQRKRLLAFVVGASASGKSVFVRYMTALAQQPRIAIDPATSWAAEGVWVPKPWDAVARVLRAGFVGSLIFDDCDRYLARRGAQDTWGILWTQHRHLGVDAFLISRRVQELPELAWASADRLFVFKTPPGAGAAYLYKQDFIPRSVRLPSEPLEYLDVDLYSGGVVRRRLPSDVVRRYGNPRGF